MGERRGPVFYEVRKDCSGQLKKGNKTVSDVESIIREHGTYINQLVVGLVWLLLKHRGKQWEELFTKRDVAVVQAPDE